MGYTPSCSKHQMIYFHASWGFCLASNRWHVNLRLGVCNLCLEALATLSREKPFSSALQCVATLSGRPETARKQTPPSPLPVGESIPLDLPGSSKIVELPAHWKYQRHYVAASSRHRNVNMLVEQFYTIKNKCFKNSLKVLQNYTVHSFRVAGFKEWGGTMWGLWKARLTTKGWHSQSTHWKPEDSRDSGQSNLLQESQVYL